MINTEEIASTLRKLDNLYNQDPDNSLLYSKLAMLELCGWIEVTLDELLFNACDVTNISEELKNQFVVQINNNKGFHYENNLAPLLKILFGLNRYNIFERTFNKDLILLKNELNNTIMQERNLLAHTNIRNNYDSHNLNSSKLISIKSKPRYDAPSVAISKLENLSRLFTEMNKCVFHALMLKRIVANKPKLSLALFRHAETNAQPKAASKT